MTNENRFTAHYCSDYPEEAAAEIARLRALLELADEEQTKLAYKVAGLDHEPSSELFKVERDTAHPHIMTITPSSDAIRFGNWTCPCGQSMTRPMCGSCDNDE